MERARVRATAMERSAGEMIVRTPLIMGMAGLMVAGIAVGCWLG